MRRRIIVACVVIMVACGALGAIRSALGLSPAATATPRIVAAAATATPRPSTATRAASTATIPAVATIAPTPTPRPTVPVASQPAAAPSAAAVAFRSGGLGQTRADWEKTYQKPEKETLGMFTYANGNYLVMYYDGRVSYLEHVWGDQDAKSRAFAEGASKPFLPSDARLVKEYTAPRSGNTVVLYHSDSLAGLLPPAAFIGGDPGDFIVILRDVTGKVTSYLIGLGNNP